MMTPISPELVYMVQKQKEKELEQAIEHIRIAKEQGALAAGPTWFSQASRWVGANLFHRTARRQETAQKAFENPCVDAPC